MPKTYKISKEQSASIEDLRKTITDKRIDKRLHAVYLRGMGMKNPCIAVKLDTSAKVVILIPIRKLPKKWPKNRINATIFRPFLGTFLIGISISQWVSDYCNIGIESLLGGKYGGNRRNMTFAEEEIFLAGFKKMAETGKLVEVSEIKKAYEEKVGHKIGKGQIYRVLKRHKWRKVMPRSKHPNKASDEEIESSKKLTLFMKN